LALQTLLLDVVGSFDAAAKIIEELWPHNTPYIRNYFAYP